MSVAKRVQSLGKGFETCGECAELDTCPTVGPVLEHSPDARNNLMA